MRKTLFSLAALGLVASFLMIQPATAKAGSLTTIGKMQGAGAMLKDGTNGQSVTETYDRGYSWSLPVAFTALSGTSGVPLSVTQAAGYTSAYKGPWKVRIYSTSATSVATSLTYSAAYADASTANGQQNAANATLEMGPLSPGDYLHLRGLSATALGAYQIGTLNR